MVTNLPINLKVDQDIHSPFQAVVQDHQVLEIGIKGMRDLWDKITKDPIITKDLTAIREVCYIFLFLRIFRFYYVLE